MDTIVSEFFNLKPFKIRDCLGFATCKLGTCYDLYEGNIEYHQNINRYGSDGVFRAMKANCVHRSSSKQAGCERASILDATSVPDKFSYGI